ncbi:putative nucleolar RNAse III [Emericellopsis atlantica]|uniref:Nucleolar RNAse III n=1 Tax=Emericellopsis atlantica TaxID=2614577 RepID=A0A9P7ZTJ4_9HYPO|nr:putative nucleolar RNAse III [Emericellopsis atlantica]KAG9258083.1 putative nucleolar RNAse III [Emericellopsis atlantica]
MSKRQLSSLPETDLPRDNKRPRSTDAPGLDASTAEKIEALSKLADNAQEVIDNLQQLLRWRQGNGESVRSLVPRWEGVARNMLGPIQSLASENGQDKIRQQSDSNIYARTPLAIPPFSVEPWRSSEIPTQLPPLPPIKDPELERLAFLHIGVGEGGSYERLEWIGDAYLELISTNIISRTFPKLRAGRCSQLREQLIRNVTLSRYFREYGLASKARLPPEVLHGLGAGRGRSNDKDITKTQGDMFEAYVAAIIMSDPDNGLATCIRWLRDLWSMTLREQIVAAENEKPTTVRVLNEVTGEVKDLSPKERISHLIRVPGVTLEYRDLPCNKKDKHLKLPVFAIGLYLTGWGETGRELGLGTAQSKKEAAQKAATQALENRKLLKTYEQKKRAYVEAQKQAEDAEQSSGI